MKKFTYALIIITTLLFLGSGFFQSTLLANTEDIMETSEESLLNITTVSKNQYLMVKSIVLDKHNVEYLSENESEINNFEYNEEIIEYISSRDLFIYSGVNNEPWIYKFIGELKKGDLGIINMSRGIKTLSYKNNGNTENPYYWLGINEYKIALYNIKCAIQEKDTKNKSYYEENYNNITNELDKLLKEYKSELEKFKGYTILTDTNTFDYLLEELGLQVIKVEKEITRKILDEKNLDENKIIFVKEKNPIEIIGVVESKKDSDEIEVVEETENLDAIDLESEKPLDIKNVELIRWDLEKTLPELTLSNIKLVIETFEKLPVE